MAEGGRPRTPDFLFCRTRPGFESPPCWPRYRTDRLLASWTEMNIGCRDFRSRRRIGLGPKSRHPMVRLFLSNIRRVGGAHYSQSPVVGTVHPPSLSPKAIFSCANCRRLAPRDVSRSTEDVRLSCGAGWFIGFPLAEREGYIFRRASDTSRRVEVVRPLIIRVSWVTGERGTAAKRPSRSATR